MKNEVVLSCAILASGLAVATPKVTLDSLVQERPNKVVVSYTLAESPGLVTVSFETNYVNDAQETVWVPLDRGLVQTLAGDVNKVVQPGSHSFAWKARADWPDQTLAPGQIRANLKARRLSNPPDYAVIDLEREKDAGAIAYYETADEVPGGVTNAAYKTTKLLLRRIHAAGVRWRMGASYDEAGWNKTFPAEAPHMAVLSEDYYIGVYEFTQKQYEIVAGYPLSTVPNATPSSTTKNLPNAAMRPVTDVSYEILRGTGSDYVWPQKGNAVSPTRCLGLLRTRYGFAFDMPTCAQWEYAYRAGTASSFFTGDMYKASTADAVMKDYTWTMNNTTDDDDGVDYSDQTKVHVVGKKLPNPWGLYDIAGNAAEVCLDWAVRDDNPPSMGEAVDPVGPASQSKESTMTSRIWRGGSCIKGGMMGGIADHRATACYTWSGTYKCMGFRICCPAVAQ